jgi:hypothetical protein
MVSLRLSTICKLELTGVGSVGLRRFIAAFAVAKDPMNRRSPREPMVCSKPERDRH